MRAIGGVIDTSATIYCGTSRFRRRKGARGSTSMFYIRIRGRRYVESPEPRLGIVFAYGRLSKTHLGEITVISFDVEAAKVTKLFNMKD